MSWQAYVDDHLMCEIEGNHLSAAAIIGHDAAVWAQSPSFSQVLIFQFFFLYLYFGPFFWVFFGNNENVLFDSGIEIVWWV